MAAVARILGAERTSRSQDDAAPLGPGATATSGTVKLGPVFTTNEKIKLIGSMFFSRF
jgi:hypothetical protein